MGERALSTPARRAVFLDRDGVLNENVFNAATQAWESPLSPDDLRLTPTAIAALQDLQRLDYALYIVSNQPNAAKRKATLDTLARIHDRLITAFDAAGVRFAGVHYCYHHPEGVEPVLSGPCDCRKPSPQALLRAAETDGVDLAHSWMVGDRDSDMECGRRAGVRTIYIRAEGGAPPGPHDPAPDAFADDLAGAVRIIAAARPA